MLKHEGGPNVLLPDENTQFVIAKQQGCDQLLSVIPYIKLPTANMSIY